MSQRKLKREPLKERELEPEDRRGWLSHGLAAVAISALGLTVAGSVALTTSAESGTVGTVPDLQAAPQNNSSVAVPAKQQPNNPQDPAVTNPKTSDQKEQDKGTLAFERRDTGDQTSRSRIRSARVAEQALERRASLEQAQQKVARSGTKASNKERNQQLADTSQQTQENELRLIEEKKRKAEEARKRAEQARNQSQQNQNSNNAASSDSDSQSDSGNSSDSGGTTSTPDRPTPEPDKEAIKTGSSGGASPVSGAVVGAPFGAVGSWSRYHTGIDFRAGMGVPIRAVKDGTVLFAGNSGDWAGNHVAVKHGDGMTTQSSHMSRMSVSAGQSVKAGQVIGYVGQTGRAFGAHLHFELYPSGVKYGDVYRAVNPAPWLQSAGVGLN